MKNHNISRKEKPPTIKEIPSEDPDFKLVEERKKYARFEPLKKVYR